MFFSPSSDVELGYVCVCGSDIRADIDEALSEMTRQRQAQTVARAAVDGASNLLATLMARVADLTAEASRFSTMPPDEQTSAAAEAMRTLLGSGHGATL